MSVTRARVLLLVSLFVLGVLTPAIAEDLTVIEVDTAALTTDCQTLQAGGTVEATVENVGASPTSGGFTVLFFEDANGNGIYDAGTDLVLGQDFVAVILDPEDQVVASTLVAADVTFAGNLVYAFADSDDDLAETDETNNIESSGASCRFDPPVGMFDPVLEWSWTSSTAMAGWVNVMMTPSVIDLDADDIPDVVFASTSSTGGSLVEVGVLRALRGTDGSELFTVVDPNYRVNTASSIATGDIDLDGSPEIIACDPSGARLIVFEHDGTFKWRSPVLESINWGAPAIADLDADGIPEIVIGRQVLDNSGVILWTGTGGRGSQGAAGPISAVADLDLDGVPEVVAGNTAYTSTGAIHWIAPVPDGTPAVADFDDDPFPEIVLVSGGTVRLLNHDGSVAWGPVAIPAGGAGGPPTVADYDADGEVEIGVAGASRYAVFETDGTLKWAALTQDASSNRTGSSVFDFEGDGNAEVVYSDELTLRIFAGTDGTVLFQVPLSSCTWYEYPLVADVDADGNAEIVSVANNNCGFGPQRGIFVYGDLNDTWVATRQLWNQHTYHITNINDDGSIPILEENNWQVPVGDPFNNYRQNVLTTDLPPTAAPDLTASSLGLNVDSCPDQVGLTARVGNGGSNLAAAPVNVAFYDGDPDLGGALLGVTSTSTNLDPGDFEDVTLFLAPPLEGAHTICAVADDDGAGMGSVSECDETNNKCCADFDGFCILCDPDPKSQGYWHRQCLGIPANEGGIDPGRNGRGPQSPTEPLFVEELMPCAEQALEDLGFYGVTTCEGMDADPPNEMCEKALKQLTALILNICSNRLQPSCNVDLGDEGCASGNVGELLDELAMLILGGDCTQANDCAAAINEGEGIDAGGGSGAGKTGHCPIATLGVDKDSAERKEDQLPYAQDVGARAHRLSGRKE